MAAPKGNNYYLKRASHGREKIFSSPEVLWQSACEYFDHVDANPIKVEEPIKSGDKAGTCMTVNRARPYTLRGLCLFLGCDQQTFDNYRKKPEYEDYFGICEQIVECCYTQKFEGASSGIFNASIIARDLGLVDKKATDHSGQIDLRSKTDDELDEDLDKLINETED